MAFRHNLATLLVNVVVNQKGVQGQLNKTKLGVVSLAAKFYILRAAIDVVTASISDLVQNAAKLETGFGKIERVARQLRNTTFRSDFMTFVNRRLPGESIESVQRAMENVVRLGVRDERAIFGITEAVQQFARVTGVSADEAALSLGRLQHLFQFKDEEIAIRQLGGAIIAVAEALPVTEQEIVSIVSRLGSVTQTLGMSAAETIALAGAVKATGTRTEVSASAMVRALTSIATKTREFAESMQLSTFETAKLLTMMELDPAAGFTRFLELLRKADFQTQSVVLKELGLAGFRAAPAIRALTGAIEGWYKAQEVANAAVREGDTLLERFTYRAKELRASITNLENSWIRLKTAIADSPELKVLIGTLALLVETLNKAARLQRGPMAIGREIGFHKFIRGIKEKGREELPYMETMRTKFAHLSRRKANIEAAMRKPGANWYWKNRELQKIDKELHYLTRQFRTDITRRHGGSGFIKQIPGIFLEGIGEAMVSGAGGFAGALGAGPSAALSEAIDLNRRSRLEKFLGSMRRSIGIGLGRRFDMTDFEATTKAEQQREQELNAAKSRFNEIKRQRDKDETERKRGVSDQARALLEAFRQGDPVKFRGLTEAWKEAAGKNMKAQQEKIVDELEKIVKNGEGFQEFLKKLIVDGNAVRVQGMGPAVVGK